jgi:hypothetical protein
MTETRIPPTWGVWLLDPSGKYGPHKVFAEHGETAADAATSAIARYKPNGGGVCTLDAAGEPYMINPARLIQQ